MWTGRKKNEEGREEEPALNAVIIFYSLLLFYFFYYIWTVKTEKNCILLPKMNENESLGKESLGTHLAGFK